MTLDWNDLRTIAEVARRKTMSGAARALGVHPTTVARRIAQAEEALGEALFLRAGKQLTPASAGARIVRELEPLVDAVDEVAARVARPSGRPIRVALTDNGARIAALITLPLLSERMPEVEVELLSGNRTLDLARSEADFALRVVEPTHPALVRRLIGHVRYGLYASPEYLAWAPAIERGLKGHRVLIQGGILSNSPEARYMSVEAYRADHAQRCSSMIALGVAAEQGLGLVALPKNLGRLHANLELVRDLDIAPRPLWLVVHEDLRSDARVSRVAAIFAQTFGEFLAHRTA